MNNRVACMVTNTEQKINSQNLDPVTISKLQKSLDMELDEYCRFQQLKSLAVAGEILSIDEGMTIYNYLGESPDTFNHQSLCVKITLTKIFAELLEREINVRRMAEMN